MKKCSVCQQVKPLVEFSKKDHGKYSSTCKKCAAKRQRLWYEGNKQEISIKRSVNSLNRTLNVLRRKATQAGFKLKIEFTDQFVATLEKLK